MTENSVRIEYEKNIPNIRLFLDFLQVIEPPIPDSFRWSMSIKDKTYKMQIAYEDVLRQIPIWQADNEEMKEKGYGSTKEGVILALRYETFLNSIYSLCESLACLVAAIYLKENLSPHFSKQKKAFLAQKRLVDTEYASILDSLTWYDEVNAIRGEATHFLSGFTTISKDGEPGYFNEPKGDRQRTPQKISLGSVEKHIQEIFRQVDIFLLRFGDHFIQKIDPNKRMPNMCMLDGKGYVGFRERSINEIINQRPGICHTPLYQCPVRQSCEAFRDTPQNKETG